MRLHCQPTDFVCLFVMVHDGSIKERSDKNLTSRRERLHTHLKLLMVCFINELYYYISGEVFGMITNKMIRKKLNTYLRIMCYDCQQFNKYYGINDIQFPVIT